MENEDGRIGMRLDEVAGKRGDFVEGVASWNKGILLQILKDQKVGKGDLEGSVVIRALGNSNQNNQALESILNQEYTVKKAKKKAELGGSMAFLRKALKVVDPVEVWPVLSDRLESRKRYQDLTLDTIEKYIQAYIADFDRLDEMERYKWKAIKHFQDHWDIEAHDFASMLNESLSNTENLLASANYGPREMIKRMVEVAPEEVRQAFVELYDLRQPLVARIDRFITTCKLINDTDKIDGENSYQDARAAMVYLSFRYPEQHYLYKYDMFGDAIRKLSLGYKAKKNAVGIIPYEAACDFIKSRLIKNDEVMKLHQKRLNREDGEDCYRDPNLTVLAQDFIYAVAQHLPNLEEDSVDLDLQPIKLQEPKPITNLLLKIKADKSRDGKEYAFKTDREQQNARLKEIGDLGEQWMVNREKRILKENGRPDLAAKVEWVAKTIGDGLGYDIESRTLEGKKMYIEVKSTTGGLSTPFYITKNELDKSKKYAENYYLYRVYAIDEEKGSFQLETYVGPLTPFCQEAWTWRIVVGWMNDVN